MGEPKYKNASINVLNDGSGTERLKRILKHEVDHLGSVEETNLLIILNWLQIVSILIMLQNNTLQ